MAQRTAHGTTIVQRLERVATNLSALFLFSAAGIAALVAIGDPNAASDCLAGAPLSPETATQAVRCLGEAGFGPSAGFGLAAVACGVLAGLLGTLRSRAEDRVVIGTMRAAIEHAAAREREA